MMKAADLSSAAALGVAEEARWQYNDYYAWGLRIDLEDLISDTEATDREL